MIIKVTSHLGFVHFWMFLLNIFRSLLTSGNENQGWQLQISDPVYLAFISIVAGDCAAFVHSTVIKTTHLCVGW